MTQSSKTNIKQSKIYKKINLKNSIKIIKDNNRKSHQEFKLKI